MDTLDPHDIFYNKCFACLRRLCGEMGTLPSRFILPATTLVRQSEQPLSSCGYADLWRGSLEGQDVALKAFRIFQEDDLHSVRKVIFSKKSFVPSSFCALTLLFRIISYFVEKPYYGDDYRIKMLRHFWVSALRSSNFAS